jgi:hypothetical protein
MRAGMLFRQCQGGHSVCMTCSERIYLRVCVHTYICIRITCMHTYIHTYSVSFITAEAFTLTTRCVETPFRIAFLVILTMDYYNDDYTFPVQPEMSMFLMRCENTHASTCVYLHPTRMRWENTQMGKHMKNVCRSRLEASFHKWCGLQEKPPVMLSAWAYLVESVNSRVNRFC